MTLQRLLLTASAVALLPAAAAADYRLHILHVNDVHSRIEPINASDATCPPEEDAAGECFGGAARLMTAIGDLRDELSEAGENVIVLDAGDQFQGSLFFTTYSGQAEVEMMNAIGFDAMVFGNHEFNLGPLPLAAFVEAAEFPVVFGNVDASQDERLGALNDDPLILEVGGERIAIVGAVTPDTAEISQPGPTVAFDDPIAYLTETVEVLRADGVTKIIALTHVGVLDDIRIAEAVPGLDAVVGGHSHTLFSNGIEDAPYAYPHMVEGPDGRQVPVVQAGAYSKYLGHLTLTFDAEGNVTQAEGDTMLIDASVEPDEGLAARIDDLRAPIEEAMNQVVASVGADVDGSRESCRSGECEMGNLVAEAMLDRVADQGIAIAIQNGGGLRASIAAGETTVGDVVAVLPFQNTLATFELSGANLVAALENGVGALDEGAGRFPQVAGLQFTFDPEAEPGSRIVEVLVEEDGEWLAIDAGATYGIVSNNFMRNGGDGYAMFRDEGINAYDFGPNLEVVLADYLMEHPDYEPFTDGRIARAE
ncbi:bifunctional UDP-sugar hydrolase/5'-nucleotidase [soil metagenome]